MPKTWFTSDLHLGHANILKHQPNRPWETVQQMDDAPLSAEQILAFFGEG